MKKYTFALLLSCSFVFEAAAQSGETEKAIATATNIQKTANAKDIMTTFFRAGIENLLGTDHKYSLNSSFYGIDSILRKRGTKISYEKQRYLRQSSLNFLLTGDSANNVTKIGGGFTFTVINKKDIRFNKFAKADSISLDKMQNTITDLRKGVTSYIYKFHGAAMEDDKVADSVLSSWNDAARKHDFTAVHRFIREAFNDPRLIAIVKSEGNFNPSEPDLNAVIKSYLTGNDPFNDTYNEIAQQYARKPLWTIAPTGVYDRGTKQGEFGLASDFTAGLTKDPEKKPWEIEAKLRFKVGNDTTINNTSYKNKPASLSFGVNKVLIQNEEMESRMEFKFFTQYDYQFGSARDASDKELFTLNSTLRINIFKSLWLPLTVKYDPKNANVFGYFSFTANLGN